MTHRKAYIYLLINAFLWGIAPAIIKMGGLTVPFYTYLFYRFLIVAIILVPYIVLTGNLKKSVACWLNPRYLLIMLLFNPVNLLLMFYGLFQTTAVVASVASATLPIVASILGVIFLREKITKNEGIGTILGLIGILMVTFFQSMGGGSQLIGNIIGFAAITLANIEFVYGNILFVKVKKGDQFMLILNSYLICLPIMFLLTILFDRGNLVPDMSNIPMLASVSYMAIFGSIIALTLSLKASTAIEISEANLFTYLQPVFGVPFSVIFLGEAFSWKIALAIGLIIIGMWLSVREKLLHHPQT